MDLATIFGMILAWGALGGAMLMEGGDMRSLVNLPAALLVFGGTVGAAMMSFRMDQIRLLPGLLRKAFRESPEDITGTIGYLVGLSERTRREGMLLLERESNLVSDDFLARGMRLAADGVEPELLRDVMTTEIHFLQQRHKVGVSIFTTMGGFAPTLGIIGTVIGLIHMLANLSDPGKMGPLIAGAFIATLYGVASANLIFLPLANKLRGQTQDEAFHRELMVEGILAIQAGDNPRIVDEKLRAFIAPRLRKTLPGVNTPVSLRVAS
jgi:chemotaxis protein MotA